jgi:hypothetical protein
MKITTESGTTYTIRDGHCIREGARTSSIHQTDAFKVWTIASIPDGVETLGEALASAALASVADGVPIAVGKRMYIDGSFGWFISTPIVSIEEDETDQT